jgi:hypothetical protein
MGLTEGTKVTKKLLWEAMTGPQYQEAWQAYSDRLKQQVEQSLTAEDDLPDHPPPSTNGQPAAPTTPEPAPDERLRWGALSRRAMKAGLSPTTWEALRQGVYADAERLLAALEGPARP